MKKLLSLLLCCAIVLTLLPSSALAVQTYYASEACVAMIQELEGYREFAYTDSGGRWYIGYGSEVEENQYPMGISMADADLLMRMDVSEKEASVNRFLQKYNITVNQNQFDALVSLTYNLGEQWMDPKYRLCAYLISGIDAYSELEIVNAIATWCHQGKDVVTGLVSRRLREAMMFLYGIYDGTGSERFTYVHYDAAGGEVPHSTVFYLVGQPYNEVPTPVWENRVFLSWYTFDNQPFTGEGVAEAKPFTVTARWVGDGAAVDKGIDYSGWANPFSDMTEKDWYFNYVRELNYKKVIGGYEDSTFRGDNKTTAGEALKMILLAAGYDRQEPTGEHWASGYLALAERLGCLAPGEVPDLEAEILRITIAKIATVALGLPPQEGASPFVDAQDGYLLTLYREDILDGDKQGRYRYYYPGEGISRGELCKVVSKVANWEYQEKPDPDKVGFVTYFNKTYPLLRNVPVCPYNPDLFVKNGSIMYYNDPLYATALGVDVSSWQKEIDWTQVADAGIEFAMLRVGYRGYGEAGTLNLDPYFQQYLEGARAAGLKVGVYFYSQAISADEAEEEARFVLDALAGVPLDYPVVYDWENGPEQGRAYKLDSDTLTSCAITFCEAVAAAGYKPMVYYNMPIGYTRYELSRLTAYPVWFAQYAEAPSMYYDYRIWQYTDSGSVPGIPGKVDMNLALIPY